MDGKWVNESEQKKNAAIERGELPPVNLGAALFGLVFIVLPIVWLIASR